MFPHLNTTKNRNYAGPKDYKKMLSLEFRVIHEIRALLMLAHEQESFAA
jgi:hypothetical protein